MNIAGFVRRYLMEDWTNVVKDFLKLKQDLLQVWEWFLEAFMLPLVYIVSIVSAFLLLDTFF